MDAWKSPRLAQKTYDGESKIEELLQCLVYISVELERTREAAKLQDKLNEAKVLQLQSLLERAKKERDEFHRECEKLREYCSNEQEYEQNSFNEGELMKSYEENDRFCIIGDSRQARDGDVLSPSMAGDEGSQVQLGGASEISCEDLNGLQVEKLNQYVWNADTATTGLEWGKKSSTIQSKWSYLDPIHGSKYSNVSAATVAPKQSDMLPTPSPSFWDTTSSDCLLLSTVSGDWQDSLHGPFITPPYQQTFLNHSLGSNNLCYQPLIPVNQTCHTSRDLCYRPQIPVDQIYLLDMLEPKTNVAQTLLPEKGNLLQTVMESGPLLQTLLLAGAMPEWNHPPHLNTI